MPRFHFRHMRFRPEQFYGFAVPTLQLAPDASEVGMLVTVTHDYEPANATLLGDAVSKTGTDGRQGSFRPPL
jgi:hypothetical protein